MRSCQLIKLSLVSLATSAMISVVFPVVAYVAWNVHVPKMSIALPFAASILFELSVLIWKPVFYNVIR